MAIGNSPLRYPGGKQILAGVLSHLIELNEARGGMYAEPYAGGAGAGISLLFGEHVDRILINDADRCVYAFWRAVLDQTEAFVKLIGKATLSVPEWRRQRAIYQNPYRHSFLKLGFATFYLNRCNRSGIIGNAGPIGGIGQKGTWKIDARFNREDLERRIRKIALYRERISIFGLDAVAFLRRHVATLDAKARPFVYLDPPYFSKGRDLYLNHYSTDDHATLATYLKTAKFRWVLSYDQVPEIEELYRGFRRVPFDLDYSARERRVGREVMILKEGLSFPSGWNRCIPQRHISLAAGASIRHPA